MWSTMKQLRILRLVLRRRWTVVTALMLFVCVWILTHSGVLWCTEAESLHIISAACQDFEAGRISGSMCTEMCAQFTLNQCSNYHEGKVVLVGKLQHLDVVLKSEKSRIDEYDSLNVDKLSDVQYFLKEKKFHAIVRQALLYNTGFESILTSEELLHQLFMGNVSSQADITSLWSLLQQEEFKVLQLLARKSFPKIIGSCGHFYFVEYVTPIATNFWTHTTFSWTERARLALKYLDFVDDISPLHFCDMKQENFGMTSSWVLKAVDADMVVMETRLGGLLGDLKNCTKDEDCGYFDCRGFCDASKKLCLRTRKNSNLQAVCEKIFLLSFSNLYGGLLQRLPNIPIYTEKLESLITLCANSTQSDSTCLGTSSCKPHNEDLVYRNLYKTIAQSIAWDQV